MYTIKRRIAISDVGSDNNLKPISLLEMIGDCEQFQIDDTPYITNYFNGKNYGIFVTSRQIDFVKSASYGDEVSVSTSVFTNNRISGQRNTFIYDESGQVVARSYVMGAFVDLKTQAITKIDKDYVENYPYEPKLDMEYLPRKINVPKMQGVTAPIVTVPAHYIDYYNHMNNVNYVAVAIASANIVTHPNRIRVEYKTPAVLGDTITPTIYKTDSATVVELSGEKGVFAIVEIS